MTIHLMIFKTLTNRKLFATSGYGRLLSIISWLLQVIKPTEPVRLGIFRPILSKMWTILRTRGKVGLVDFTKSTRLALLHCLSGEFPLKKVQGVPVYKDGYPKSLGPELVKKLKSDTTRIYLRLVLTLLFSTRALSTGTKPDLTSIQSPCEKEPWDIGKYSVQFWRDLGYRPSKQKIPRGVYFKKYHFSTKAGPNGQAMWTSLVDLKLIKDSNLGQNLKTLGGPRFSKSFDLLQSVIHWLPSCMLPVEGYTLRRLTHFPDMEHKVRVVAILDYWSQTVLRGLHDYLFGVLRKVPQDCTFNQGSFLEKTKGWKYFYSFDLTAATDRFPIDTICQVLKGLLPEFYVQAWKEVMVGLPFDSKFGKISYQVGNPMGAYSSWNSFTVAHHYIMYWCCQECGITWTSSKYIILGDDVLIGDHQLAMKYAETMARLGVQISPMKTHQSAKLYEFAKRLVLHGVEVTPFPISALAESSNRFYLMVALLQQESRKGWLWPEGIPSTVEKFYEVVLSANSRMRARIEERSYLSDIMMRIMSGSLAANDGLNSIIRRFDIQLPQLTTEQGFNILSGVAVEVFAENNPLDSKSIQPFGVLAEDWVIQILTKENFPIEAAALDKIPSIIPVLNLYGQVCDKWLDLSKQAYLIDTIGKGEWPMHLRTMALPFSDKVFSERASHTITRVGALLADKVKIKLETELVFIYKNYPNMF